MNSYWTKVLEDMKAGLRRDLAAMDRGEPLPLLDARQTVLTERERTATENRRAGALRGWLKRKQHVVIA